MQLEPQCKLETSRAFAEIAMPLGAICEAVGAKRCACRAVHSDMRGCWSMPLRFRLVACDALEELLRGTCFRGWHHACGVTRFWKFTKFLSAISFSRLTFLAALATALNRFEHFWDSSLAKFV